MRRDEVSNGLAPRPEGRPRHRVRERAWLWLAVALAGGATLGGCGDGAGGATPGGQRAGSDPGGLGDAVALASPIPDSAFARLVDELSEPDRYFDTDNLISNESSYLHVIDALEEREIRGGVYIGVGPAQNFSYMTAVWPELAFMIDIRRDNLLQHLWYKALFEAADTRLDFLCAMVGRDCGGRSEGLAIREVVARVDGSDPVDTLDALVVGVVATAAATGVPLSAEDRAFIASVHHRFAAAGLDLRFSTHGRAPQPYYPTLRQLLLERDHSGRQANYLATEDGYLYLAALQRENRVVPVVGDLAGDHAVRAIGDEVSRRELRVSTFYVSNVEFYLFGDGRFSEYVENLRTLPLRNDAVLIRSYFNRFRALPRTVPGYASTQLLHTMPALLAEWEEGRVRSYRALIAASRD